MKEQPWTTADVGDLLRRTRRAAEMSMPTAAEGLGRSITAVSGWENGRHCPDAADLLNALEMYGFSLRVSRPRKRDSSI